MAFRTSQNQSLHDKVIETVAKELDIVNFNVYTNPNVQKNTLVNSHCPDIIITKKGQNTVEFIIEVETADSINIIEATNQWKKFSNEINASFWILVPANSKHLAISLCKQIGITAGLGTYQVDNFGNVINISYE